MQHGAAIFFPAAAARRGTDGLAEGYAQAAEAKVRNCGANVFSTVTAPTDYRPFIAPRACS